MKPYKMITITTTATNDNSQKYEKGKWLTKYNNKNNDNNNNNKVGHSNNKQQQQQKKKHD